MIFNKLGKSELKISKIGQGTGQFGTIGWGYNVKYKEKDVYNIIEKCIENNINLFDTSETYGDGLSETLLGNGLKRYNRDEYVIISKVAPWNLRYNNVIKSVQRSLSRLNLKYIDVFMVHYPNFIINIKETFSAMEYLVKIGKIKYIGVSNFNTSLLKNTQDILKTNDIIANEIEYNIFSTRMEKKIIPFCLKEKIDIISYSPLAGGILTGPDIFNSQQKFRAHAFNFYNTENMRKKNQKLFEVLNSLANKHSKSVAQIALNYIIRKHGFYAIPCALNPMEVVDNANSCYIQLTDEEINQIIATRITIDPLNYFYDHSVIRNISWIKESIRHSMKDR